jgi:gelsolin
MPVAAHEEGINAKPPSLYRLSDASGQLTFETVEPVSRSSLASNDAFLLDNMSDVTAPAIYVWIGSGASLAERRLAVQYGQTYLYSRESGGRKLFATNIVKMKEGQETEAFLHALSG